MQTNPVPLQLAILSLKENLLEGTLPESWSECISVSNFLDTICCHAGVLRCLGQDQMFTVLYLLSSMTPSVTCVQVAIPAGEKCPKCLHAESHLWHQWTRQITAFLRLAMLLGCAYLSKLCRLQHPQGAVALISNCKQDSHARPCTHVVYHRKCLLTPHGACCCS